jgi:serine protease inhibitor
MRCCISIIVIFITDVFSIFFFSFTEDESIQTASRAHNSFVLTCINEAGLKDAASTGVDMTEGIKRPLTFWADHPFLFTISENQKGIILFIGSIVVPLK